MSGPRGDRKTRPLRVLQAVPDPLAKGDVNPYVMLLARGLEAAGVEATFLKWPSSGFARFDVLHVHWPESLVRNKSTVGRLIKRVLAVLLLARIAITRTPVVRTMHNVQPHEAGDRFERWFLRSLESRTRWWICMNSSSPTPDPSRSSHILHGHYRDHYPHSAAQAVRGRLLSFGLIRRYKGLEHLLDLAPDLVGTDISEIRLVGRADDPKTAATISKLAGASALASTRLEFVSDAELSDEIAMAEAVVLPYTTLHNSGAALLALSLGRPIIVPSGPATRELVDEFGDAWVYVYEGALQPDHLIDAVQRFRSSPSGVPPLDAREWSTIGEQTAAVYRKVVRVRRRARRTLV